MGVVSFSSTRYNASFKKFGIMEDVNRPLDSLGFTALMYAVSNCDEEKIDNLLEKGADPFKTNKYGDSAFSMVFKYELFCNPINKARKFLAHKRPEGKLKTVLDSLENDVEFAKFVATDMIKNEYGLRDLVDYDEDGWKECFYETKEYCHNEGMDIRFIFELLNHESDKNDLNNILQPTGDFMEKKNFQNTCRMSNVDGIVECLNSKTKLDIDDKDHSPIHIIIRRNHKGDMKKIVALMIDRGIEFCQESIISAVEKSDPDVINLLFANIKEINLEQFFNSPRLKFVLSECSEENADAVINYVVACGGSSHHLLKCLNTRNFARCIEKYPKLLTAREGTNGRNFLMYLCSLVYGYKSDSLVHTVDCARQDLGAKGCVCDGNEDADKIRIMLNLVDTKLTDKNGDDAFTIACKRDNDRAIEVFTWHLIGSGNPNPSPLIFLAEYGYINEFKKMLAHKPKLGYRRDYEKAYMCADPAVKEFMEQWIRMHEELLGPNKFSIKGYNRDDLDEL